MKKRIRVTAKDIGEGERFDAGKCPVAKAIMRTLKGDSVAVDGHGMVFCDEHGNEIGNEIRFPEAVERFVKDFDCHKIVKPFSFTLEIPDK